MGIHQYNRLKAAIKRVQSGVLFDSAGREQARTQFKIVLAEKEKNWHVALRADGPQHQYCSRWMTNKVQPSVEQLYEITHHLDIDVKELLVSTK